MNTSFLKSRTFKLITVLSFLLAGHASPATAGEFANSFVSFELPPGWQCLLEGSEWVCQNSNEAKKKEAIIVLAAKYKGDQDSIDAYRAYLKAPKTYTSVQGKPVKSEPKFAEDRNINGNMWVDALHYESEIPGFLTRYFATVKEQIGVLVTWSIRKDRQQDYLNDIELMKKTLKVFYKKGQLINAGPASGNLFSQTNIPAGVSEGSIFSAPQIQGAAEPEKKPAGEGGSPLLLLVLIGGAAAIFILKKRKG